MVKNKGKLVKILALSLVTICVLCTVPFYIDTLRIGIRNFLAPNSKYVDVQNARLLYEFPGRVFKISWLDDASSIRIFLRNSTSSNQDALPTIVDYHLETEEIAYPGAATYDSPIPWYEETDNFEFDKEAEYWSYCEAHALAVAAGGFEGEQYWVKYWESGELVKTFVFSSKQWPNDYYTPRVSLAFSPTCAYAVLILSGWVYYEGAGHNELWLLDFSAQTFDLRVLGKMPSFGLWDYPVQSVTPSWSPNEDQFVFGGGEFGVEIYDIFKLEQRFLAGPQYNLYDAKWSPSGHWIAATQWKDGVERIYVFSPDGSLHSFTDGCDLVADFWWAPEEDKIVYRCHDECNELCTETCGNLGDASCPRSDYLWLWNLE